MYLYNYMKMTCILLYIQTRRPIGQCVYRAERAHAVGAEPAEREEGAGGGVRAGGARRHRRGAHSDGARHHPHGHQVSSGGTLS